MSDRVLDDWDRVVLAGLVELERQGIVKTYVHRIHEAAAEVHERPLGYGFVPPALAKWVARGDVEMRGYGGGTTYHLCRELRDQYGLSKDPAAVSRKQLLVDIEAMQAWRAIKPPQMRQAVINALIKLWTGSDSLATLEEVRLAAGRVVGVEYLPLWRLRSALKYLSKRGLVMTKSVPEKYGLSKRSQEIYADRLTHEPAE